MENNQDLSRKGSTRRAFLSASAVTAVAAPIVSGAAPAIAAPKAHSALAGALDPDLRALLDQVDTSRIHATVLRLTQFGTRHTASSQTDPVRGIGAATAWVFE
jgi:hypothetical protein